MMAGQVQAQGIRRILLEQIARHHQITQRFTHLLAFILNHRGVKPVAHKGLLAGGTLNLGKLTFVMGEQQIRAATVQIDGVTKQTR